MKITFQRTAALIVFSVVMPGPINSKINAGITPNRFLITEICKIGKNLTQRANDNAHKVKRGKTN